MKKVIVTGATGFIGRYTLQLLKNRGFEVHGISSRAIAIPGVKMHQVDLLKPGEVEVLMQSVNPSHLLHFAWITAPGVYWNSPDNERWLESSLRLVKSFQEAGGQRVVMAGTCAEYDWSFGICHESKTPLNPTSLYGQCKKELLCQLQKTDIDMAWGRIFFLYGPHEPEKKLIASVICSLLKGETALCSHGNQKRDFLHVQDVADAFATLLDSDLQGAINIGSGQPVTLKSLCLKVGELLGLSEKIVFGAIPSPANEAPLITADVKRLNNELGWKPTMDVDAGIQNAIAWWKSQ